MRYAHGCTPRLLMVGPRRRLRLRGTLWRKWIIPRLGVNYEVGNADPDLDVAIGVGLRSPGLVSQRVLVPRIAHGFGVGLINSRFRKLRKHLASGRRGVLGEQIVVPLARQVELGKLAVNGQRRRAGGYAIHRNLIRQENF